MSADGDARLLASRILDSLPRAAPVFRSLRLATAIAGAFMVLAPARAALSYPQWQLTSGARRCNECHYAPAGGGLLRGYGRYAAGEELSTFGGDGAFLHGAVALPAWLALGADLRGAFVDNDVQDPAGPTAAAFPMQADASVRVAFPAGVSLAAIVGLRGQVRDPDVLVPIQNYQPVSTSEVVSREHYLLVQPDPVGVYLRVGRFFAPFGLRFAEHIFYVRRDLGFDELEETYNVSAGVIQPEWELHVSLFGPDFVRHIGSNESGVAAYFERRLANDDVAVGAQARVDTAAGRTRIIVGGIAKGYVERARTMLFAEIDGVRWQFEDPHLPGYEQVIGIAGLTLLPIPGIMATLAAERNQLDVEIPDAWSAGDALVSWFPWAHFELQVLGRLQLPTGGELAKTFFFQLHYFL